MKTIQKLSFAASVASATFAFAAGVSKDTQKTIQPENVLLCEAACETRTLNGHNYKVIETPRFTVMVSISHEGIYTRADVSIANHTDMPLAMSPDDFRVEVVTPKPKVLLYVPPSSLVLPPPPTAAAAPVAPPAQPTPAMSAFSAASPAPEPQLSDEEKQKTLQEAADKAATDQYLAATSIAPNEIGRGRVYFERDRRSHLVNVVLPIAGLVFEFPYTMKK
jgi:hypothetical protein